MVAVELKKCFKIAEVARKIQFRTTRDWTRDWTCLKQIACGKVLLSTTV